MRKVLAQLSITKILTFCTLATSLLAAEPPNSIAPARNLALPANGGAIAWYTSKGEKTQMADLVSENNSAPGWRSKDAYLPQEIVFAFDKDGIAAIDRIVITPKSQEPAATWAKTFLVLVSQKSPLTGFKEVGQFDLIGDPKEQTFPVGQPARFLKIRIIKNGGGPYTSIGKVKILEGAKALLANIPAESDSDKGGPAVDETGVIAEREPNNSPAEAIGLLPGQRIKGTIDPLGEQDYFRINVPGRTSSVLTFDLRGQPNIRTSLSLLESGGKVLKRFDPGQAPAQEATFSWRVNPGDYTIQMTEPVVSIVLVWDTSESMRNDIGNLKTAVEAYLNEVRPSERLKLIRFSKDVEVITPEFLSDPVALKKAAQGKFEPIHGTSLYNAIAKGVELLEGVPGNRAIVLMTDGSDSSSVMEYAAFWKLLAGKKIRLYNIALGGGTQRYSQPHGTFAARMLNHAALATDGRFFQAKT